MARKAGIAIKMLTGDYRRTAERIARNIGLLTGNGEVVEGAELAAMSDDELSKRVGKITHRPTDPPAARL